jgi:hypothetical protein
LVNLSLKIFKTNFLSEISKLYGCDIRLNKNHSDPPDDNKRNDYLRTSLSDSFSDDEINFLTKTNLNDNILYYSNSSIFLKNENNYQLYGTENKHSILEEVYTFDFQAKYFLEQ